MTALLRQIHQQVASTILRLQMQDAVDFWQVKRDDADVALTTEEMEHLDVLLAAVASYLAAVPEGGK